MGELMGFRYVVTFNRPCYPSIEYFDSYEDAYRFAHDLIKEEHEEEAVESREGCKCSVTVSKVLDFSNVYTWY